MELQKSQLTFVQRPARPHGCPLDTSVYLGEALVSPELIGPAGDPPDGPHTLQALGVCLDGTTRQVAD